MKPQRNYLISRTLAVYLLIVALPFTFISCGPADNHARMVQLLEQTADRAETENEYVDLSRAEEIEKQLNSGGHGTLEQRFMDNWRLSGLYLNLGKNQEAVKCLEMVHRLLPEAKAYLTEEQINTLLFETAIAHLRVAEAQNCIHCETGEGCILPIQGGGVHQKREGSRNAIKYLQQLLQRDPSNLRAVWLLNIAYMTLGEHEQLQPKRHLIPPERFAKGADFPAFKEIARDLGVAEFSCAGGSVLDDIDGDGDLDLVVSNWDVRGELKVYLNQGDGKFKDHTASAGLKGITGGLNMVQGDYDNDGDVDILVLRGAWLGKLGDYPNSLLQNQGDGSFRDVTFETGLGEKHYPTQTAAFADYDNDGDLDLYIGNESFPCQLFQNNGGHFTDVAAAAGVADGGFAKGVVWGDYDNDRWPDLYVSDGTGPNRLFHNNGDGTFTDVAASLKVTGPELSFPVWFWDYNNDGHLDIYASSYNVGVHHIAAEHQGETVTPDHYPAVYKNDGKGGFTNVAADLGLTSVAQPMGANFGDLDNDGFLDFYLGTGYTEFYALMPNRLFHNRGGQAFEDVTVASRTGHVQKGHGVSFGDFDNDGDQDLFVETGGAFRGDAFRNTVFENPGNSNNYIQLKLTGETSNRSAIGARIRVDFVEDGKQRSVHRRVCSGGSFGANPLAQHIGVGAAGKVKRVEIYWPTSDTTQTFENIAVNQHYAIREGSADLQQAP